MIIIETCKKTLTDELKSLDLLKMGDNNPANYSFVMGAKAALLWVIDKKDTPSEIARQL